MESTREGPRVNAEALDDVSSKIADSEVGLARVAAAPSALLVAFLSLMPGGYPVGDAEFSVCLAATAAADGLSRGDSRLPSGDGRLTRVWMMSLREEP